MANFDSEMDRFNRLATEGIESILAAIQTSDKPWHGFQFVHEIDDETIKERVRKIITSRIPYLAESIELSEFPSPIIWSITLIPWILENEGILNAISKSLVKSSNPWSVYNVLLKIPDLVASPIIRQALVNTIIHNTNGSSLIRLIIGDERFISEHQLVEIVASAIDENEEFWFIIQESQRSRTLFESKKVWDAIESRIEELAEKIRNSEDATFINNAIRNVPRIVENPLIISALAHAIEHHADSLSLVAFLPENKTVRDDSQIHGAIAALLQKSEFPWHVIAAISPHRSIVENNLIQESISKRIEFIADSIEREVTTIMELHEIRSVITHPLIISAIKNKIDHFGRVVHFDGGIHLLVTILRHGSSISAVYENTLVRSAVGEYLRLYHDYNVLEILSENHSLMVDPLIIEGLLDALQVSQIPSFLVKAISNSPVLMNNDQVQEMLHQRIPAIVQELKDSSGPWVTIGNILRHSKLSEHPDIQQTILELVASSDMSWMTLTVLRSVPTLTSQPVIQNALQMCIGGLVESIEDEIHSHLLHEILAYTEIMNSPDIQSALTGVVDRYAKAIGTRVEFWWSIKEIGFIERLRTDQKIKTAILSRLDDLVHAINFHFDPWTPIRQIDGVDYLLTHELVLEVLVNLLTHSTTPWKICGIESLELILNDRSIRDTLLDRADDIAFRIENSSIADNIIQDISKIDFLVEHPRIREAIYDFECNRALPSNIKESN